jgi:MSHA biogenesis protein MshO
MPASALYGPPPRAHLAHRGFTLIELVLVMVLMGVLLSSVAVFVLPAVRAYESARVRDTLASQADAALRRMGRDLALALPNSVRLSSAADTATLELIPTRDAGRYRTQGADPLDFGVADSSFEVLGFPLSVTASQELVLYNLGTGVIDADAYNGSNRRTATNAAGLVNTINLPASASPLGAGLMAPPYRVYAVDRPVSYHCNTTTGLLTRHLGYGFNPSQQAPPSTGSSAVLATGVSGCSFLYEGAAVAARAALVTLRLSLNAVVSGNSPEKVTLLHAVHVENAP